MFEKFTTYQLQQVAFRITPRAELAGWVATGPDVDQYTEADLRDFVVEQLDCYGITAGDINAMRA